MIKKMAICSQCPRQNVQKTFQVVHNHRTQPTNATKRTSKQSKSDSTQAKNQRTEKQTAHSFQARCDHYARKPRWTTMGLTTGSQRKTSETDYGKSDHSAGNPAKVGQLMMKSVIWFTTMPAVCRFNLSVCYQHFF